MSIWKRFKNLWYMSAMNWHVTDYQTKEIVHKGTLESLFSRKKMAKIVEPQEYLDDIPTEPKDI